MSGAPGIDAALRALAPHGRVLFDAARDYAISIHAEELGPEHLLCALMADPDGAARRAVEHAFADPETIASEALAMASGILVSGSAASLPFSPLGVRALEGARALAAERRAGSVREAHLLVAAVRALPAEVGTDLALAGFGESELAQVGAGAGDVRLSGPLFRQFSEEAKRALSAAARTARQDGSPAIAPAHLVLACLGAAAEISRAAGISAPRARSVLRGRTRDDSRAEPRALEADEALAAYSRGLAPGAGSLELLARFHGGATPELAQLLARHRVTTALLARVADAFRDPH